SRSMVKGPVAEVEDHPGAPGASLELVSGALTDTPRARACFSQCSRFENRIEAWKDSTCVPLVNPQLVGRGNGQRVNVALRVIEVVTCLRVDAAHGADHLRAKQDVVDVDHSHEQVDARLMIDAGVEEHVLHHMFLERWALEHIRQAPVSTPVIGY